MNPVKLLKILQLENYDLVRFLKAIPVGFSKQKHEKKKIELTKKLLAVTILGIFQILFVFFYVSIFLNNYLLALVLVFLLSLNFYVSLTLSLLLLLPLDIAIKGMYVVTAKKKISKIKNLKVIAITGSYAKSSVKEILYYLVKDNFKSLRTPESYNTPLGISKVIDYELDDSYELFIAEIAAYKRGDISSLSRLISPDYGVITGIAPQHLERFGSIKNIIKTKFELYDFIRDKDKVIFNLQDPLIKQELTNHNIKNVKGYADIRNIKFSKEGSEFDLTLNNKNFHLKSNLFGFSNIQNLSAAISAAKLLGVDTKTIISKITTLPQFEHRFELKKKGESMLIDNTFSSNLHSFEELVKTTETLNGKKMLITPGLVELGKEEKEVHKKIGRMINGVFDKIILVGKTKRTLEISKQLTGKFSFIEDDYKKYNEIIRENTDKYHWIFLENDLTENY